jgi:HlyD family secretion protein
VKAGETIALLDRRRLDAQVAADHAAVTRAQADVERAKSVLAQSEIDVGRFRAGVAQAKAEVERTAALLAQAESELGRQRALAERRFASQAELDTAVANHASLRAQAASAAAGVAQAEAQVASAEATVATSRAQVAVAEAAVRQSEAQLRSDEVNVGYATIVSPVDGVVVSRNVDVGQTVAASLQAPTLFVIANDLTKIQVQASVPEADIGRIHDGQDVTFDVDAHPDRVFQGKVTQVRLASTTVQNVVTYTVLVDAANPDGLLLPGMTANVTFEIQRSRPDVIRVPSSALRLQVTDDLVESTAPPGAPATEPPGARAPAPGRRSRDSGTVWVTAPGNRLRAVRVRPGITDGIFTAVEPVDAASLAEGTEVVTAVIRAAAPTMTNPFGPPQMGMGGRRSTTR